MTEREQEELMFWTNATINSAAHAGLLQLPYCPTEHAYTTLHGYQIAGLTPDDAAQAYFGVRH